MVSRVSKPQCCWQFRLNDSCCRGSPGHYRTVSSIPGPHHLLDASSTHHALHGVDQTQTRMGIAFIAPGGWAGHPGWEVLGKSSVKTWRTCQHKHGPIQTRTGWLSRVNIYLSTSQVPALALQPLPWSEAEHLAEWEGWSHAAWAEASTHPPDKSKRELKWCEEQVVGWITVCSPKQETAVSFCNGKTLPIEKRERKEESKQIEITHNSANHRKLFSNVFWMCVSFPGDSVKNLPAVLETQEMRVWSLGWKDPWRRTWQPTPVFWPRESHGQRSPAGYSPWGHNESKWWAINTFTWNACNKNLCV